jgi:UDP-2,3-diacylglucosamine hydrolase
MKVTILSDLHIRSSSEPAYARLLHHIETTESAGNHVVFAGDIFEVLTGNSRYFREKFVAFFNLIRSKAASGVQFYYIEGNHDFNLESLFRGTLIRINSDPVSLTVGKYRLWVDHGDAVDNNDVGYQIWRTLTRSPPAQTLVDVVPGVLLDWVGGALARSTDRQKDELPEKWDPGRLHSLRLMYRRAAEIQFHQGYDFVVMGHCHDFDSYQATVDGRDCTYFNMGYPKVHGKIIECDEDGIRRIAF